MPHKFYTARQKKRVRVKGVYTRLKPYSGLRSCAQIVAAPTDQVKTWTYGKDDPSKP